MNHDYILSCESTVDLPYSYVHGRGIEVLFYSYLVNETEYKDDMGRDPEALPRFYGFMEKGILPTTSQLNTYQYVEYFEELLKQGKDILHIAFGSGMTPSVNNAWEAAELLREKYPERRLEIIDSLCSSSGYGLLTDGAADLWDEGKSIDEVSDWVMAHRKRVHHQFYSTTLEHYRRSGRVSGAAAAIGSVLGICPVMRLDDTGHIIAYDKVRGKKNALRETISMMEKHANKGTDYDGKCFICHSNCLEQAKITEAAVREHFPHINGEIRLCDIGTIIAAHCGPGTVAVFFFGDEREPDRSAKA